MFERSLIHDLVKWKDSPGRKPLILRGARQVGKTTAIREFSKHFDQYIYLNLEIEEDAKPFREINDIHQLAEAIFFLKNKSRTANNTLIFIDEIQEVPEAIGQLRYFFEMLPGLHVIAAGSLLDVTLNESVSVPVGRVEYRIIRPASFREYLVALGETAAVEQFEQVPLNDFAHDKLLKLFHTYTLIGGMPEIVNHYTTHRDLTALQPIYDSLLFSYLNDVEKYARNVNLTQVIRHCIRAAFPEASSRIKFQGFGHSNYGSREAGEALRTIEKAMLLHLVYPTVNTTMPVVPDLRKSPRLHILDTGLINHFAGLQKKVLGTTDLQSVFQGKIAEHIVGQELLSSRFDVFHQLHFWVREKKTSSAEIDFVIPYEDMLVPVEVKVGATGKMKSLQMFMDIVPHRWAVRLYSGPLRKDEAETATGKKYTLLNLPYYLASQLERYVRWMME